MKRLERVTSITLFAQRLVLGLELVALIAQKVVVVPGVLKLCFELIYLFASLFGCVADWL